MYTLFGAEGSGSTAIEIALKYCGADYRLVAASSWEEGSVRNELRRLNPLLLNTHRHRKGWRESLATGLTVQVISLHPLKGLVSSDASTRRHRWCAWSSHSGRPR